MFLTASLLILLLALSITGSPVEVRNSPIIIPLTRKLNFSNGTIDLVQHDKARVAALREFNTHGQRAEIVPMSFAASKYTVALGVGNHPTTSVARSHGLAPALHTTDPGFDTGLRVGNTYGGGQFPEVSFSGTVFVDTVTLGDGLTIYNYLLAVASTFSNFENYDDLTVNTLTDNRARMYPTFTDYLVSANAIPQNIVGIFFQPTTRDRDTNVGELAFGGPDYTKLTNDIVYHDVTNTFPSTLYWGIDQRITYGDTDILFLTAGVIDTGCDFIFIASDAYGRYQAATGATLDERTGLLCVTLDQYTALRELKFHIDNQVLTLVANAQIWPRSLNSKIRGAEEDGIYLIIKSLDTATGSGRDFIIGYTFMQRFYNVLNHVNRVVGFATTSFTDADTNSYGIAKVYRGSFFRRKVAYGFVRVVESQRRQRH
ncbi:aspartic peptidase domain-containing protein [Suillus spraguei]|nr:aspartic peptidase domain-containing protein [Suillus spraguei]